MTYSWLPVYPKSEHRSNAKSNDRYPFHRPVVVYFLSYSDGTVRLSNTAISPSNLASLRELVFGVVSLIPKSFALFCSTLDCCKDLNRHSVCFAFVDRSCWNCSSKNRHIYLSLSHSLPLVLPFQKIIKAFQVEQRGN